MFAPASILTAAFAGAATGFQLTRSALHRPDLQGKVVLITGGSRGLGLELARTAMKLGARVAICGRNPVTLQRAKHLLEMRGEVLAIPCDIRERANAEELIFEVEAALGPIHVLVNNAGIIQVGPASAMTLDDYEQSMDTHFWGPLHLSRCVIPLMERRGGGHIINIASIGGRISVPHLLPYSASKYALVGFSRGLRAELRSRNVQVTTVTPGLMRTGSPRNATFLGDPRREYQWFRLGDSLPLLSLSAASAAHRIFSGALRGRAEICLDVFTRLSVSFADLFPNLTEGLLTVVQKQLPADPGPPRRRLTGAQAGLSRTLRILTWLTGHAEIRNNELAV